MLMLGISDAGALSVGLDSVVDPVVEEAAVVVELAVLVGSSSPRSRKNNSTPTPASTTTADAMIQGSGLFFCGGWP
jgi:hypothetical protein